MPRGRPVSVVKSEKEEQQKSQNDTYKSPISVFDIRMSWTSEHNIYTMQSQLDEIAKRWVFQIEKGESGYIHLQGRISLIKKVTNKFKLLDLFDDKYKPNYIAPTVNEEFTKYECQGKAFYQMKKDTRIEGPYTDESKKEFIPREYDIPYNELYPFQQVIYDNIISYLEHRLVNLIYCPTGCKGKSTIAMICKLTQNSILLPYIDDPVQLMYAAHNMISAKGLRTNVKIFVDLPRACNKKLLSTYLLTIENLKSGFLYDLRNKYKEWIISPPIIYVFCNRLPNLNDLSTDRWRLWMINDKKQLIKYNLETGVIDGENGKIPILFDYPYLCDSDSPSNKITSSNSLNSSNESIN